MIKLYDLHHVIQDKLVIYLLLVNILITFYHVIIYQIIHFHLYRDLILML